VKSSTRHKAKDSPTSIFVYNWRRHECRLYKDMRIRDEILLCFPIVLYVVWVFVYKKAYLMKNDKAINDEEVIWRGQVFITGIMKISFGGGVYCFPELPTHLLMHISSLRKRSLMNSNHKSLSLIIDALNSL
jgi:hypothetical protein